MISAIILLDNDGEIITMKTYRSDFNLSALDNYRLGIISKGNSSSPINMIDGFSFLHHHRNDIYYIACTKENVSCDEIFELLNKIPEILAKVMDVTSLTSKIVRHRVCEIVEILDEMIDSGYIQCIEPDELKRYTSYSSYSSAPNKASSSVSISLPWRPEGITYSKQVIYVNIREKISLLITKEGIINKIVNGQIILTTQLSGMPRITVKFNDTITDQKNDETSNLIHVNDIVFHQCVDSRDLIKSQKIHFIPPDGEFELMSYRKIDCKVTPFKFETSVQNNDKVVQVGISIFADFDKSLVVKQFRLIIPLPDNTGTVSSKTNNVRYDEVSNCAICTIYEFQGKTTNRLELEIHLLTQLSIPQQSASLTKSMYAEFEINKLLISGLALECLETHVSNANVLKYFKFCTMHGAYNIML